MKVEKTKNSLGYGQYVFSKENKSFTISYEGDFGLYWRCDYQGNMLEAPITNTYTITKEDYAIYSLFDQLYDNIKNKATFLEDEKNPQRLLKNNDIEWHSDDFDYENASCVFIHKGLDCYQITFKKSNQTQYMPVTYWVRFRTNGSRYNLYNMYFIKMYENLIQYDENDTQIYIEEYLYQQKILKKRK